MPSILVQYVLNMLYNWFQHLLQWSLQFKTLNNSLQFETASDTIPRFSI